MKRVGMEVNAAPAPPGSFARSVLTLMTGTTLANLVPVAISPILARLYAPADFGMFALYTAVAALLAVLATGRYEMAIVLPAADTEAVELLLLALGITLAATAATAVAVVALHGVLPGLLQTPALAPWLALLPVGVLLMGTAQALTSWLNRKRDYPRIAASRMVQAVATAALMIGFARAQLGPGGLVLGALAGQALALVPLALATWAGMRGSGLRPTRAGMRAQAVKHRDFPRINALHALADNVNASVTLLLLTRAFGADVTGHYSMVLRVLTAPVAFIGTAVSQVFYQRAAELRNAGGDIGALVRRLLARSALVAVPAAVVLFAGAPWIFTTAFGAKWALAGQYARILSPYMAFAFLAAPLAFVPFVVNRQGAAFLVSVTGNALFLACIFMGSRTGRPETAFTALAIVQCLYFAGYIAWIVRIASAPPREAA